MSVGRASEVVVVDAAEPRVLARIRAGTLPWGVAIVDVPVAPALLPRGN